MTSSSSSTGATADGIFQQSDWLELKDKLPGSLRQKLEAFLADDFLPEGLALILLGNMVRGAGNAAVVERAVSVSREFLTQGDAYLSTAHAVISLEGDRCAYAIQAIRFPQAVVEGSWDSYPEPTQHTATCELLVGRENLEGLRALLSLVLPSAETSYPEVEALLDFASALTQEIDAMVQRYGIIDTIAVSLDSLINEEYAHLRPIAQLQGEDWWFAGVLRNGMRPLLLATAALMDLE